MDDVMIGENFEKAFLMASELHRDQKRKTPKTPFIGHPLHVAAMVIELGGDEATACAAILHDTVEDCGGAPIMDRIREELGDEIAQLVDEVTETDEVPKPPWKGRKEKYLAHLMESSDRALLIALCDKVCNTRNIMHQIERLGSETWRDFNAAPRDQAWWHQQLVNCFMDRTDDLSDRAQRILEDFIDMAEYVILQAWRHAEEPDRTTTL